MTVQSLHILVDNRCVDQRLAFEHGWSVWLDLGPDGGWLWDTGQTGRMLDNAALLGLDPATARGVALSHGHYDHTGGLRALCDKGFDGPIIGHAAILARRYSRRGESTYRAAGMDELWPDGGPSNLRPVRDVCTIAPGLTFVTDIVRRPGAFEATANLFRDTAGRETDTVPDDACLVIDGARGPLVLLGCCHSGLANTLHHLRARLGLTRVTTVVGGLHLATAPTSALRETRDALAAFDVQRVHAGHCTGEAALSWLREHSRSAFEPSGAGLRITP